jgi:hypothetical protein
MRSCEPRHIKIIDRGTRPRLTYPKVNARTRFSGGGPKSCDFLRKPTQET